MGKIQVLTKNVSDKIAAGEVVERPASVVKELLENAVDAHASTICVEIKGGGIRYVRVTDNGIGMSKEDVAKSILRHATSKISTEEDLTKIKTLGFRGEALSSICAVSRLEIYTKTKEEDTGTHLVAENGEIIDCAEAGCPGGTTIVVRDLFSTVPARMKFLKKDFTEAGYVEDIVARLALSHPEISVKFFNNEKEVIFTPGDAALSSAVYAVYGKDIEKAMVAASYEERGVTVSGLCGKGVTARGNRSMENFFVNGRYIKSPLLSRAAEEAYKNELMVGKFPVCVLSLTLPPQEVDINVHPTKLEAKFADEKHIYHCVYWAVKNALYRSDFVPQASEHKSIKPQFERVVPPAPKPTMAKDVIKPLQQNVTLRESGGMTKSVPIDFITPTFSDKPPAEKPQTAIHKEPIKPVQAPIPMPQVEQVSAIPIEEKPVYKICGQVFATYIIIEKDGKMLMVDQHAAHERLRYEKLLLQYQEREITTQMLLSPEVFSLSPTDFSVFSEHEKAIYDLGILAEEFGEKQVIIRGTPLEAGACDAKEMLLEIIEMFSQNRKRIDDDLASKMLYRIACRGAVKANAILSEAEMKRLLDDVLALSGINTCPHGRPIMIEFTKEFIEKQFKRIV